MNSLEEIENRAIQATLRYMECEDIPLDIHYIGDIPTSGGLASSSAFIVGLLNCLSQILNKPMSRMELAQAAIKIERGILQEKGGHQDQMWAAFGGFNMIEFQPEYTNIKPVLNLRAIKKLEQYSCLYYTNISRQAGKITSTYKNDSREEGQKLKGLAYKALKFIEKEDIIGLGSVLMEGWELKKQFGDQVSNREIDEIYSRGLRAGAIGGKLLGAGGGGAILFLCPPSLQENLDRELFNHSRINFEFTHQGTEIIFHE